MNLFGVGLPEMAVILVVGLLIFGPRKLPEIGRTVAKTIKSLQSASKEFEAELRRETSNLDKPEPKAKAAITALAEAEASAAEVTDQVITVAEAITTAEAVTEGGVASEASSTEVVKVNAREANGTEANGTEANGTEANGTEARGKEARGKEAARIAEPQRVA